MPTAAVIAALAAKVKAIVTYSLKRYLPPDVQRIVARNLTVNETRTIQMAVLICEPLI